jgi:hypothetical protein
MLGQIRSLTYNLAKQRRDPIVNMGGTMPQTYVPRTAEATLQRLAKGFPVVGITGPRQSGKTTLAKHCFPQKPYVSLENPTQLAFAQSDPVSFLAQFPDGAVLDEAQRCPDLFSYFQGLVDEQNKVGQFVLTGSQQFGLRAKISQSLAGRIGLLHLLPFSVEELKQYKKNKLTSLENLLFQGFFPPLYSREVQAQDWYASYVQTYVERDVRQIINVKDLNLFRQFLRLCAGRVGQLINLTSIGNDCGVSYNTIKDWLSVLEASYVTFSLSPHFSNFSKRLIKNSKLYFHDTGMLCWLLGIREPGQLAYDAMRGAIFENFVVSELLKTRYFAGEVSNLYFWRDKSGLEIDILVDKGNQLLPIEVKSGKTISDDFFKNLHKWQTLAGSKSGQAYLVYGGDDNQNRSAATVVSWRDTHQKINL